MQKSLVHQQLKLIMLKQPSMKLDIHYIIVSYHQHVYIPPAAMRMSLLYSRRKKLVSPVPLVALIKKQLMSC